MTIATAKLPGLITTSLILPHPILTAIGCCLHTIMNSCPLWLLPLCHHTHVPACHCLPLVSPECSNDGEEESGALNVPAHFSQEPYYIHDEMIEASPGPHPKNIHDL
jgi:hypothetical protein